MPDCFSTTTVSLCGLGYAHGALQERRPLPDTRGTRSGMTGITEEKKDNNRDAALTEAAFALHNRSRDLL